MAVETDRWGIIYNPKAGSRKAQKKWNAIRGYMESRGVMFDYLQSEGYGSVERLARMLANNGYRTIVIVGGDGAINDAINGIMTSNAMNKSDIALGIVPNGIGNDFASYWGLDSDDYKEAVDWIINRRLRKIDVDVWVIPMVMYVISAILSMPCTLVWEPVSCGFPMVLAVSGECNGCLSSRPCSCSFSNASCTVCI